MVVPRAAAPRPYPAVIEDAIGEESSHSGNLNRDAAGLCNVGLPSHGLEDYIMQPEHPSHFDSDAPYLLVLSVGPPATRIAPSLALAAGPQPRRARNMSQGPLHTMAASGWELPSRTDRGRQTCTLAPSGRASGRKG
jgi:hypothetical protein